MKSLSHQFLDFCRSKPADEEIDLFDRNRCAFAQFADDLGLPVPVVDSFDDMPGNIGQHILNAFMQQPCHTPFVFGALASRLEAELAK